MVSIGLFCKRALQKRRFSAKETYNCKEPTNRSHPISCDKRVTIWWWISVSSNKRVLTLMSLNIPHMDYQDIYSTIFVEYIHIYSICGYIPHMLWNISTYNPYVEYQVTRESLEDIPHMEYLMFHINTKRCYRVAKTHRMPHVAGHFSQKGH